MKEEHGRATEAETALREGAVAEHMGGTWGSGVETTWTLGPKPRTVYYSAHVAFRSL